MCLVYHLRILSGFISENHQIKVCVRSADLGCHCIGPPRPTPTCATIRIKVLLNVPREIARERASCMVKGTRLGKSTMQGRSFTVGPVNVSIQELVGRYLPSKQSVEKRDYMCGRSLNISVLALTLQP